MTINQYLTNLNTLYQTGNAREHSYRGDLQNLLSALLPDVLVTNEPARVDCGAPDYSLTKKGIPIGYIEAKDIGVDLKSKTLKEQFDRYKAGLSNLIITDYLNFQFFNNGELTTKIRIAEVNDDNIVPIQNNFNTFTELIKNFALTVTQSIKSPTRLAQMMAGKARLMADVIEKSLNNDDKLNQRSNIKSQMLSFQQMLIHDINNKSFADIYAQTIAYGMFAARYHDPTLEDFSRTEAAHLIPKSNPFLRKLFQDIAGYDLDDRLVWIVDELVSIFLASDVAKIMKNFGKATKQEDPVVHFYETFLGEYSPALRKARGVWYTPEPVVNFIVRSVDEVLKTEFGLAQGLADTSKTTIKRKVVTKATADARSKLKEVEVEEEVHKVQILDPATGTGTFLAEVVKQIYSKFKGQQGIWSNYVKKDLIPRLNGFELLMASYAMAHLKMDMLFTETGVTLSDEQRLRIYLTNSLEKAHKDTGTLFSSWLSDEADQANAIKRDNPVMVVIGNPPYSGISSNNGPWISDLIEDYKYIDGEHFKERKHWLNDDYVKFIRFGQHFIEKNGEGILAFINPHGFTDNPTFRGMRWNLLKAFDKIYIVDLHGNVMKKEIPPNGMENKNVFDIQQGVSINIFIKKGGNQIKESEVLHYDIWGSRNEKYDKLEKSNISSLEFNRIIPRRPYYFFNNIDYGGVELYDSGFSLNELIKESVTGIVTARDSFAIDFDQEDLLNRISRFVDKSFDDSQTREHFFGIKGRGKYLPGDSRGWSMIKARKDIENNRHKDLIRKIDYRPFDTRNIYYSQDIIDWGRENIVPNLFKNNIVLIFPRQAVTDNWSHIQLSNNMIDNRFHYSNKGIPVFAPLYIYTDDNEFTKTERIPNLNKDIVNQIAEGLGLSFVADHEILKQVQHDKYFSPLDLLDYIYAVLHSPTYRDTYKEFLKIDFPRVPYPTNTDTFWQLVELGGELRQIHLLEHPVVEQYITQYPKEGDNIVTRKLTKTSIGYEPITDTTGKVWINDDQYFDNVPLVAWEFYIGGYQPAQKWLKDRKGRELNYEDILHYQKIIVALTETNRIMKGIDGVDVVEESL